MSINKLSFKPWLSYLFAVYKKFLLTTAKMRVIMQSDSKSDDGEKNVSDAGNAEILRLVRAEPVRLRINTLPSRYIEIAVDIPVLPPLQGRGLMDPKE